jgi:CheY-like chemotaxis protein/tRNA A-37 threonylcarbamoyl transferase component Bud32
MAKILYVDDDADLALITAASLMAENHDVTVINEGPEGWSILKSNQYELVILDWDMPSLNGIEILQLMRTAGDTTPVIMLTGRTRLDDKMQGLDTGANDYLTKPFEVGELLARIRAALRTKVAAPPPPKPLGANNEHVLNRANLTGTALAARFEFVDVLGEGGVAIVFKARHPQLDKFVAIKMLQGSELSEEDKARFESEARIVSKLDHPNIVTVYDYGVTERKQPYMVMELVDGPSLRAILEEHEYVTVDEALPILLAITEGLAYAHDYGVLHRDIKPDNVVLKQELNHQPIPRILDFGLAKLLQMNAPKSANLTQAQQIVGSPAYMSPEQVRLQSVDERSDIYSFGCLMFEVLTGYAPFLGDNPLEIALKHVEENPLTLGEVRPELVTTFPPVLEHLIGRALEKDPAKRFQTIRELQEELQKSSLPPPDSSLWNRLRKFRIF